MTLERTAPPAGTPGGRTSLWAQHVSTSYPDPSPTLWAAAELASGLHHLVLHLRLADEHPLQIRLELGHLADQVGEVAERLGDIAAGGAQ